eukprot:jgi/Tetstr1/432154/TSEL_021611.t1
MGIPSLLKLVNPICEKTNLYALARGRRLGIDGHVWLHQLGYHHAQSLVLDKEYEPLAKHFLQQAQTVLGRGVDLLFVFDGAPMPAKRQTDAARQVNRAKAFAEVQYDGAEADPKMLRAAVTLGWPAVKAAISELRRAEKRALGLLSPTGMSEQLPPVSEIRTPAIAWHLTEEMIDGAKFPALDAQELVARVKERQKLEQEMEGRQERVLLRDPHGRSLHEHILANHPDQSWHFVEATNRHRDQLLPTDGWLTGVVQIWPPAGATSSILWQTQTWS